jgi:hypothetical protein
VDLALDATDDTDGFTKVYYVDGRRHCHVAVGLAVIDLQP